MLGFSVVELCWVTYRWCLVRSDYVPFSIGLVRFRSIQYRCSKSKFAIVKVMFSCILCDQVKVWSG